MSAALSDLDVDCARRSRRQWHVTWTTVSLASIDRLKARDSSTVWSPLVLLKSFSRAVNLKCLGACEREAEPSAVNAEAGMEHLPSAITTCHSLWNLCRPPLPLIQGGSSWRRSALSIAAMCRPCADLAAHAMNFAALGHRAHGKTGQEPTVAAVLRPRVLCASGTPVICSSEALRLRSPLVSEILRIFCAVHRAGGTQCAVSRKR